MPAHLEPLQGRGRVPMPSQRSPLQYGTQMCENSASGFNGETKRSVGVALASQNVDWQLDFCINRQRRAKSIISVDLAPGCITPPGCDRGTGRPAPSSNPPAASASARVESRRRAAAGERAPPRPATSLREGGAGCKVFGSCLEIIGITENSIVKTVNVRRGSRIQPLPHLLRRIAALRNGTNMFDCTVPPGGDFGDEDEEVISRRFGEGDEDVLYCVVNNPRNPKPE